MVRATTLYKVAAHDEGVWSLAWAPDAAGQGSNNPHRLLTGSVDETVRCWDVPPEGAGGEGGALAAAAGATVSLAHTFAGQTLGVVSVAVDPTGEFAAASALDSTVRVWSLRDGDRKSTRLNSSHVSLSRMPSSA